jgi:pimeloyl-ACP methyl ester carboxylesterase
MAPTNGHGAAAPAVEVYPDDERTTPLRRLRAAKESATTLHALVVIAAALAGGSFGAGLTLAGAARKSDVEKAKQEGVSARAAIAADVQALTTRVTITEERWRYTADVVYLLAQREGLAVPPPPK